LILAPLTDVWIDLFQAKDAHVGVVKAYSAPLAPKPPTLPSDVASELSAYDVSEPTKAEVKTMTTSLDEDVSGADTYLSFLEQDHPKVDAHH